MLYYLFLRQYDAARRDIASIRAKDVSQAQAAERTAAARMHVSPDDFPKVDRVYQRLAANLATVDSDANEYRDAVIAGKQPANAATIQSFSTRRSDAIAAAIAELEGALGPSAWTALKSYVAGPFRTNVVVKGSGQ